MPFVSPYLNVSDWTIQSETMEWWYQWNTRSNSTLPTKHTSFKDTHRLKVKTWEELFHVIENQEGMCEVYHIT